MRLAEPPQLHLPAGFHDDLVYSYWSTAGFPEMVNGAGGFDPDPYDRLRKTVSGFPDARSVRRFASSACERCSSILRVRSGRLGKVRLRSP